jgi:hypothetical protein
LLRRLLNKLNQRKKEMKSKKEREVLPREPSDEVA